MPCAAALAATSPVRADPPGSTIVVTPAAAAYSTLSRNGRKPSDVRVTPLSAASHSSRQIASA